MTFALVDLLGYDHETWCYFVQFFTNLALPSCLIFIIPHRKYNNCLLGTKDCVIGLWETNLSWQKLKLYWKMSKFFEQKWGYTLSDGRLPGLTCIEDCVIGLWESFSRVNRSLANLPNLLRIWRGGVPILPWWTHWWSWKTIHMIVWFTFSSSLSTVNLCLVSNHCGNLANPDLLTSFALFMYGSDFFYVTIKELVERAQTKRTL